MKQSAAPRETFLFNQYPVVVTRKAFRRSITLKIQPDQPLCIVANSTVTTETMLLFLNSKKSWIEKNIKKIQQRQPATVKPEFENGSLFPYLGEQKYFQFADSQQKKINFIIEDGFLVCSRPVDADLNHEVLQKKLNNFYKKEAIAYLGKRLQLWSEQTGLYPKKVNFRAPRSRWGSCSSNQHISLNWKLICQPAPLIDYVIVHELCHLKHLNHSDHFWQLLESILPGYKDRQSHLQNQVHLSNFLNL